MNYTGHSGSVNSITFHPDSTSYNTDQLTVLTASGDKTAHIWKTVPQARNFSFKFKKKQNLDVTAGIIGSSEDDVDTASVKGEVENEGNRDNLEKY